MAASPSKQNEDVGREEAVRSPSEDHQEQPQQQEEDSMQGHPATQEQEQGSLYETEVKEQDRWLPIANVARIMKTALPDNAKIAKEAKECMQECVSEFISFITSEASEKCQHEKRKTVNGEDILFAMTSLGFENYSEALKIYLAKYRETNMSKANENQNQPGAPNRPSSAYGSSNASGPIAASGMAASSEGASGGNATQPVGGANPGGPTEQIGKAEAAQGVPGAAAVAPQPQMPTQPAFGGAQEDSGATAPPPFGYAGAVMQNGGAAHY